MQKNKNYEILDAIPGPNGRCPVAPPYTDNAQDGADFIRYLETGKGGFEERFRKFLPKEWNSDATQG